MAKAKKSKQETAPTETEQIIGETVIGSEPPSVTLDEVKDADELVVTEVIPEPPKAQIEVKAETKPIKLTGNSHLELSMEQKIVNFIDSRDGTDIKMNDFLKSLFGTPKYNEPPQWATQSANKVLKGVLDKMVKGRMITIQNDSHLRLGSFYYPDTTTMKTEYHSLNTIQIVAKK